MLLQLAKKSAVVTSAADGRGRGRGRGGARGGRGQQGNAPRSTYSHVDAWKSINGRPFARWIDPAVDVWDARFEGEGPSNAEWLESPPMEAELDRAAGVTEVCIYAFFVAVCFNDNMATRPFSSHPFGKTQQKLCCSSTSSGDPKCLLYRCFQPRGSRPVS